MVMEFFLQNYLKLGGSNGKWRVAFNLETKILSLKFHQTVGGHYEFEEREWSLVLVVKWPLYHFSRKVYLFKNVHCTIAQWIT